MKQGNGSRDQWWAARVLIGIAFFAGCESSKSEWDCETTQIYLALDENSSLDFPPGDLLATVEGSRTAALTWVDETITELDFKLTGSGRARELRKIPRGAEHAPDDSLESCVSLVVVDAHISMHTSDAVFALDTVNSVTSHVADEGDFEFPIEHLQTPDGDGSLAFDPSEWRRIGAYIEGKITADMISGKIVEYAEKYDARRLEKDGFVQKRKTVATF
jgi:hypothetical protein